MSDTAPRHTRADPQERPHHQRALDSLMDLLAKTLRPGFTGKAALELTIADGGVSRIHHLIDQKVG